MGKAFYPVVLIPPLIEHYIATNPLPVSWGNLHSRQRVSTPPAPPADSLAHRRSWVFGCWLLSLGILLLVKWQWGLSTAELLLALMSSLVSALSAECYLRLRRHQIQKQYERQLLIYQRQLIESKKGQLVDLNFSSQKYNQQLQERMRSLKALLKNQVLAPVGFSSAQKGVSEEQFFKFLLRYFPIVSQGAEFVVPNSQYRYSADFCLYHRQSGLCIQVEIDEPYEGRTLTPHHCVDQGKDECRNQFFLEHNWVVIRFSERQVVLYRDSCCQVIAKVIAQITGDLTYWENFQDAPELLIEQQWTTAEARRMAKENYRRTYLKAYSPEFHTLTSASVAAQKKSDSAKRSRRR